MKRLFPFLVLIICVLNLRAQVPLDSIWHRILRIEEKQHKDSLRLQEYKDMTFYYMQMFPRDSSAPKGFTLSGYVDAYYAWYSDEVGAGNYQKFPTAAPISNNFGLNMLLLNAKYASDKVRGTFTMHYGDIPEAAWSPVHNNIQEANIGFKLGKRMWFDVGYFRTHLGFESIQPRENITASVATTTYYEPYYLSGVKLSYAVTDKLSVVVNAFNGFNSFVATSHAKTIGASVNYEPSEKLFITYNNLISDEGNTTSKIRVYHNLYGAYRGDRWDIGAELNFGSQQQSKLTDTTQTAYMFSSLLAVRYKIKRNRFAIYARAEIFEDANELLTGPVQNANHQLVGLNLLGGTFGAQFKATPNSYLRLEYRGMMTTEKETIFTTNGKPRHQRNEVVASCGVWF